MDDRLLTALRIFIEYDVHGRHQKQCHKEREEHANLI